MRKLLEYIRPYPKVVSAILIIKIFGTMAELLIPTILAFIINDITPHENVGEVVIWGLVMLFVALFAMWANVFPNRLAGKIAATVTQNVRQDLFESTIYLKKSDVDRIGLSSLNTRLTSDTYNIHNIINFALRAGAKAPMLIVGGLIVALLMDPVLTLVLVAVVPCLSFVFLKIFRKGVPMFREVQEAVDTMVRIIRENAQGIRVIKALSKVEFEKKHFEHANQEVTDIDIKAGVTMAISNPIVGIFFNVGLTIVVFIGAFRVNAGACEPATITAFMLYFTQILGATMMINRLFIMYSRACASMARISEVIDTPKEFEEKTDDEVKAYEAEKSDENATKSDVKPAHIVFDNVDFSYAGIKNKLQLENINFTLNRGETLGIIGGTGSGKSTLIKLIMGFYKATDGEIKIDGKDINSYHLTDLRKTIGTVQQTDTIFPQSVRQNLDFGREITEENLFKAIDMAQASEFVSEHEEGLEYMLNARGSNLSGGQKQRLYIARALAKKPEVLILDDSSSALDYKTDANLRTAISQNYKETTTIIVAQRVSSVLNADQIIVLDAGKIIGIGKHEHLLETCDVYQEISNSQLGGAIVD